MKMLKWLSGLLLLAAGSEEVFAGTAPEAVSNTRLQFHATISESASLETIMPQKTNLLGPTSLFESAPPHFLGVFDAADRGFHLLLDPAAENGLLANWTGIGMRGGLAPGVNPFTESDNESEWKLVLTDLDFGEPTPFRNRGWVVAPVPEPATWAGLILGAAVLGAAELRRLHK